MSNKMLPSGISVRIREDLIDGVSRTQTTIIVDPLVTLSGHRITMADIGTIGYGKIDQGKASEEIISWTGITDNVTTYTLTGCTWGVNFHNLENSTANIKRHVSGAQFAIMTDMHYIAGEFRDNADNVFTNTDPMEFQGNEIKLGDGTSDNDKVIKADNGDANEPFVAYDEGLNKWVISNDGVNSYDPEQGGSGVTAGDGIDITGGEVSVDVDELVDDEMLEVTGNRLGTVINEDTGLFKDANGLNIDVIDPDNPVAQSPAKLIGGDDVVLQNFIDLGAGDNDGAFKATIDGVDYDNIGITLDENPQTPATQIAINAGNNSKIISGQSFTVVTGFYLQSFNFGTSKLTPSTTASIRVGQSLTGTVLGSKTFSGASEATFDTPIWLAPGQYTLEFSVPIEPYVDSTYPYSGGGAYYSGAWQTNDMRVNFVGYVATPLTFDIIASKLQSAIRTATSKLETVVWDTDKFIITSTISGRLSTSQVLKLQPPTTGTDISGAGYLDLGANATEVAGAGDDYKLVRLDEDGVLPGDIVGFFGSIFGDGSDGDVIISTNTTLSSDKYYNNLTVNNGVTLNSGGYRVFVLGTLINNGTISNSGANGTMSTSTGSAGGAGGASGTLLGGGAGGESDYYCGSGGGGGGVLFLIANIVSVEGNIFAKGGNGGDAADSGGSASSLYKAGTTIANALVNASGGVSYNSNGTVAGGAITNVRKISEKSLFTVMPFIDTINMVALAGGAGGAGGGASQTTRYGGGGGGGGTIVYFYTTINTVGTVNADGGTGGANSTGGSAGNGGNGKIIKVQIK